jgi:transposase-like protein
MDSPSRFPKTLQEAVLYFSDPDVCLATAIRFRWPDGITCPHCDSTEHGFLKTRRIWKCKNRECRKQFSAKVGTIFEDSPIGFDKWFVAFWMLANSKNGANSWELHRAIGVTQKTAWFMFHRLRVALQPDDGESMQGTVEVDETFIGGKAANMHASKREKVVTGRGGLASGKAVVMGLLERHDRGGASVPSRARAKVIADTRRETLQPEVRANVAPGSEVMTDGHRGYVGLDAEYVHQAIDHLEKYVEGPVHTNGIENFWSLLKRCVNGTWVAIDDAHLPRYLDEQVVRFNNRKLNDAGRFVAALPGITDKRLTYKNLIARPDGAPPRRGG